MNCQICCMNLEELPLHEREAHYDRHFQNESQQSTSHVGPQRPNVLKPSNSPPSPDKNATGFQSWTKKRKWRIPTSSKVVEEQDIFWYPALQTFPPPNFTPGLIPMLRKALLKSCDKGSTTRAVLCYDRAVFIHRQVWDASWGCGYRNFLMSCAALMDQPYQPMYFPLLDGPITPGVRNLQKWIEEAWRDGFDQEGREELKKLVNTKKWIGTSDLYTAFVYRSIPAELVDVELKDSRKGTEPLITWIMQYFNRHSKVNSAGTINAALSGASPVQCTPYMPIILQYQGHSCTVIGYEMTKGGSVNLLVFDPSRKPTEQLRRTAIAQYISSAHFNKPSTKSNTTTTPGIKHRSSDSSIKLSTSGFKSDASATELTNKRPKMNHPSPVGGTVFQSQTGHAERFSRDNEDNSDSGWIEGDDEDIEFVGERRHEDLDEIEFLGQTTPTHSKNTKSAQKKPDQPKVEKSIELEELSVNDLLKFFRWDNSKIKKKNKYQILYFPMREPLSDSERMSRKVLTSERVG